MVTLSQLRVSGGMLITTSILSLKSDYVNSYIERYASLCDIYHTFYENKRYTVLNYSENMLVSSITYLLSTDFHSLSDKLLLTSTVKHAKTVKEMLTFLR
jgi:hypothetical protein